MAASSIAPQQYLAFDFSPLRVGVASGNSVSGRGQPLLTLREQGQARFDRIARLIDEWRPDALVVGVPRYRDGQPNANTPLAQRFGRQLHGRFRLPVHEVDERYTTVEAEALGASDVDATSAAIILDQFLNPAVPQPAAPGPDAA